MYTLHISMVDNPRSTNFSNLILWLGADSVPIRPIKMQKNVARDQIKCLSITQNFNYYHYAPPTAFYNSCKCKHVILIY